MPIDFSKLGGNNAVDTVLPPREIFNALPAKASRYQYLRDVQSEVLSQWFGRRGKKDIVIKMNTGSGKTIVGLLILKSCLNERKGPAVYVAPDPYLVRQVLQEAHDLGIEITEDHTSSRFLRGHAILLINIYKLINGKSVFGVSDEGSKIKIGSIVIDDAHACLSTTEGQFTLCQDARSDIYKELFALFRADLQQQSSSGILEVESHEPNKNMLVPYWAWIEKNQQVSQIIYKHKDIDTVMFVIYSCQVSRFTV